MFALHTTFGVAAKQYSDTKAMSRAVLAKSVRGHSLADLAEHFGLPKKVEMKTDGLRELPPEIQKTPEDRGHKMWVLLREIGNRLAKDFPQSQYEPMHRTIDMFI